MLGLLVLYRNYMHCDFQTGIFFFSRVRNVDFKISSFLKVLVLLINFRMQQFEDKSGQKKYADLSQQEHIRVLNDLRHKLLIAWSCEKRVEALTVLTTFKCFFYKKF